jgi:hypothetical protein
MATAIGSLATSLADLKKAIVNLPDILTSSLTLPRLTGADQDDNARHLISEANSQGWLPHMARRIKLEAVNACLSGATDDEDEIAINNVLSAAKGHDQAELYQLAAGATWEALDSSIDGDEYDQLVDILSQPF